MDNLNDLNAFLPLSNRSKFVPNLNAVRYKHQSKISNSEQNEAPKSTVDVPTNSTNRTQVKRENRFNRSRNLVQTEGVFEGTSRGIGVRNVNNIGLSAHYGSLAHRCLKEDDKKRTKCEKDEGVIESMEELQIEDEAPLSLQSVKRGLKVSENFVFQNNSSSASKFTIIQFLNPLLPNASNNMEEGPIGKVVQYKSGKWKLIIGKYVFDFQKSTKKSDANELCTLAVDDEKLHGDFVHLGSAAGYWILTPNDYNLV